MFCGSSTEPSEHITVADKQSVKQTNYSLSFCSGQLFYVNGILYLNRWFGRFVTPRTRKQSWKINVFFNMNHVTDTKINLGLYGLSPFPKINCANSDPNKMFKRARQDLTLLSSTLWRPHCFPLVFMYLFII